MECNVCHKEKELSEFYEDGGNLCGYKLKCRLCYSQKIKVYYVNHLEQERERGRKKKRKYPYFKPEPIKVLARNFLHYATKIGTIKKQPCRICGEIKAHAHHKDYSKPLDVDWLCLRHHRLIEGKNVYGLSL